MSANEKIVRFAEATETPEDRAWLKGACRDILTGVSLEKSMDVDQGSLLYDRRDHHLRKAAQCLDSAGSVNSRINSLSAELLLFHQSKWRSVQHLNSPPEEWSETSKNIFYAYQCRLHVPRSYNQLRSILTRVN